MTTATTRNHPRRREDSMSRLITRAIALAALTLPVLATPAGAVIGGTPDRSRHPYVGAVDGRPVGGATQFGSGVLISPTVFLSVAHGTAHFDAAGITRARVTFDPVVSDSSTWYEGTVHTNPAYDPTAQGQRGDFGDLGMIVFDAPIPGITPASLPSAGYLDRISPSPGDPRLRRLSLPRRIKRRRQATTRFRLRRNAQPRRRGRHLTVSRMAAPAGVRQRRHLLRRLGIPEHPLGHEPRPRHHRRRDEPRRLRVRERTLGATGRHTRGARLPQPIRPPAMKAAAVPRTRSSRRHRRHQT